MELKDDALLLFLFLLCLCEFMAEPPSDCNIRIGFNYHPAIVLFRETGRTSKCETKLRVQT